MAATSDSPLTPLARAVRELNARSNARTQSGVRGLSVVQTCAIEVHAYAARSVSAELSAEASDWGHLEIQIAHQGDRVSLKQAARADTESAR